MSLFITFEGVEGCGKSTQAKALYRRLKKYNLVVLLTHEPGGTPLGSRLRQVLKKATNANIKLEAELFLFLASRAQLVSEVIRPNLEKGVIVISDRYGDSTVAYQGYGAGISLPVIETLNNLATGGLRPNLTILLDIEPEGGLQRKTKPHEDRFETRDIAFHRKVRDGYLKMAAAEPQRWLVVDGGQSRRQIEQAIWTRVEKLLHHV